jgi:hypothetical protein
LARRLDLSCRDLERQGRAAFVTGAQDFTAKFGTKKSTYDKPKLPEARLSAVWFLVPGLILGAVLVAPLVIFARGLMSRRRRPVERMPAVPESFRRRA